MTSDKLRLRSTLLMETGGHPMPSKWKTWQLGSQLASDDIIAFVAEQKPSKSTTDCRDGVLRTLYVQYHKYVANAKKCAVTEYCKPGSLGLHCPLGHPFASVGSTVASDRTLRRPRTEDNPFWNYYPLRLRTFQTELTR